jgi:lipoprotein NlpD
MRAAPLPHRARRWLLALGVVAVTVPALANPPPKPVVPAAKSGEMIYRVREGDTLSGIAKRFGVSLRALIDANGLERPDALRLGQRLVLPPGSARAVSRGPATPSVRAPANFVLAVPDLDGKALSFRWPAEGPISSPFGRRRTGWHGGIDIKAETGTPVFAAAGGRVVFSGWEKFYGRVVKLEHDEGFMTVYAHNFRNFVDTGDTVEAGQVIATVGRTGRASTSHLHFEIRNNGKLFNPIYLLPQRELRFVSDDENPLEDSNAP